MVEMLVTLRSFMSYSLQVSSFNTNEFKTGELQMGIIIYYLNHALFSNAVNI